MISTDLKVFGKYLARNKLYTIVTLLGFSVSLMFVIVIGSYAIRELSMDSFHKNIDRIFLPVFRNSPGITWQGGQVIRDILPDAENVVPVMTTDDAYRETSNGKTKVSQMLTSAEFFDVFDFELEEGDPQMLKSIQNAFVSRSYANKEFATENPIGKTMVLDGVTVVISGILKDFPLNTHFTTPDVVVGEGHFDYYLNDWQRNTWNNYLMCFYVLAREGADLSERSELVTNEFMKYLPKESTFRDGYQIRMVSLKDGLQEFENFGSNWTAKITDLTRVRIYLVIALVILVVAVLNYINLTIAQVGRRGREAATKKLLGASKSSIIRQLFTESLILTAAAFILGVILAFISEDFFNYVLNTELVLKTYISVGPIIYSIVFVLILSLVCGLAPALLISSFRPIEVVKGAFQKKIKSGYAKYFTVFQYTVCITLTIVSAFIVLQSRFLVNYDMGFRTNNIVVYQYMFGDKNNKNLIRNRFMSVPGVEDISFSHCTPVTWSNNNTYIKGDVKIPYQYYDVDSAFFRIYGLEYHAYGMLPNSDMAYALANKEAIKLFLDGSTDNIIKTDYWDCMVIGEFENFLVKPLYFPAGPVMIYFLPEDEEPFNISVSIARNVDFRATVNRLNEIYTDVFKGQPAEPVIAEDQMFVWYDNEIRTSRILGAFTVLTILIMLMGIVAMTIYTTRNKEKEIGIRKVNGATISQMMVMLNKQSAFLFLISYVIACPLAFYIVNKWLQGFAYTVKVSPLVFIISGFTVLLLSTLCVSWNTYKAANLDPSKVLKAE